MSPRPAPNRRAGYSVAAGLQVAASRRKRRYAGNLVLAGVILAGAFAAGTTRTGSAAIFAIQRFLEFYVDVFALVALTATVAAGLIASDRVIMTAGRRITAQAVHRALALFAVAFLVTHIVFEVLKGNAHLADAVVPFLDPHRTFYVGLGTAASDLLVVIAATGIMRRRFTGNTRPWLWRAVHWTAYAAWPMAIVHGLLAGRHAKPYVDWSYGACMIVVGAALVVRAVAEARPREVRAQPPAEGTGFYLQAIAHAAVQARLAGQAGWQPSGSLPGTRSPDALAGTPAGRRPAARLPAGGPAPLSPPPVSPPTGFPSVRSAAPASPPTGFPVAGARETDPPAPRRRSARPLPHRPGPGDRR